MEFHEKLQELRKQKGMTQEELATALFVSRTAVSKWESGRGYPNIDSLKAIAAYFEVTVDALLSGEEWLTVAAKETDERVDDVFNKRVDDRSEGSTDDDADGQVHNVALHDELFEFSDKSFLFCHC